MNMSRQCSIFNTETIVTPIALITFLSAHKAMCADTLASYVSLFPIKICLVTSLSTSIIYTNPSYSMLYTT